MAGWATIADVTSLTGVTVTQPQLDQANSAIELHSGRLYSTAGITDPNGVTNTGARDIEWMRRACAYQAAWMLSQPDMFSRLELEAISATGRPVPITPAALTLAPLARRALDRVSWRRSRSLHVRSPFEDGGGNLGVLGGPVIDYDDGGGW